MSFRYMYLCWQHKWHRSITRLESVQSVMGSKVALRKYFATPPIKRVIHSRTLCSKLNGVSRAEINFLSSLGLTKPLKRFRCSEQTRMRCNVHHSLEWMLVHLLDSLE
jgi:hypothetical protein